jgi:hypothetical protein
MDKRNIFRVYKNVELIIGVSILYNIIFNIIFYNLIVIQ